MGSFSIWHWLIVLAVVILVFGTKKLRNLGADLGSAIKGFRQAMKEEENKSEATAELPRQGGSGTPSGTTIEVEVKEKQRG